MSVAIAICAVAAVLLLCFIPKARSEYGLWGPETAAHHPPLGVRPCCEGVGDGECAEWWESYQWRWVRLGDGSLWRKVVRSSGFERELPGYPWEPYPKTQTIGEYPARHTPERDSELAAIELQILSGNLQAHRNTALNGWRW